MNRLGVHGSAGILGSDLQTAKNLKPHAMPCATPYVIPALVGMCSGLILLIILAAHKLRRLDE